MASTLRHGLVNDTYVVVHGTRDPSDTEWVAYVDAMERCAAGIERVFVYSLGGAPNSSQRGTVANVWVRVGKTPPISVVAPVTAVARGVISALQWLVSSQVRLWAPDDVASAFDFLNVGEQERRAALHVTDRWLRDLGHGGLPPDALGELTPHAPHLN